MSKIFCLITICLIAQCIWHIDRTFRIIRKAKQIGKEKVLESSSLKLLFIIPCLYEQQTIVPTLLHFLKIIDETKINADIFVVTTNKEKVKNEKSKTTYEVVQEFISEGEKYKAVHLLNYPGEDGMMADQLNFVKEEIFKNYSLTATKTYFCVYNADSRPGKQAILELQRITSKAEYPLVIQEYSALFSNLQSLSPIMKGFAVYQTNFEITNGLTNSVLYSKFLRNHVVGHGLCLRFDYLQKIGGFTTDYWCEDIYLSFYLRDKDVSIYPMLALEYGETPKKLLILMKQNANWFKTLSEAKKIYHSFHHGNLYNARLYYLNQIRGAIAWLTLPIIYICFFLILLTYRHWLFAIIFGIEYFACTSIRYWLSIKIVQILHGKIPRNSVILSVEGSLAYLISSVGPIYSLLHWNGEKYKTER